MDNLQQFWLEFSNYLRGILSEDSYQNWVQPVTATAIDQETITLQMPHSVLKNYWERHLIGYILTFSQERYGRELTPRLVIGQTPPPPAEPLNQPAGRDVVYDNSFSQSILNPNYTFENFVIGEDNKMASAAALAVVDAPGVTYNPFLIYGGVGLGKTHLMQAIGNEILRRNPQAKIKYATSEAFVNDFITSIRNGSQTLFREMYRENDVLLIDDIQFLSNKDKTQEEFFHTFNVLFQSGKQIVLTSDRLPNNIDNLEERLISRFKWGLSTDITPPDLETRVAILRKKAGNSHLDINSETLTYIANNVVTNIRELEGALMRVMAYAAIHGRDITPSMAAEALHSLIDDSQDQPLTVDKIIEVVGQHYQVTPEEIKGKKRTKNIVEPRQIAMYIARELTELSFPKIGEGFGNKNHTTVIHAYEKIDDQMKDHPALHDEVNELMRRLKH